MRHIADNPRVALNFNTDEEDGGVGVIIGEAVISKEPVPAGRMQAYLKKCEQGIQDIGLTPEAIVKSTIHS